MSSRPIPNDAKQRLMRFEQLVADAYHAPIGKIDHADLDGWYGVRFAIGGHEFIVYQATDDSNDLGIDMTCQWREGHGGCEDQFELLRNGFWYTGPASDKRVINFIRAAVRRRFVYPFQMVGGMTNDF